MLISIVVITHRGSDKLDAMLLSLSKNVVAKNWELILVFNGPGCLPQIPNFLVPVKSTRIANCQPGAARNAGVKMAEGTILLFLDDDILLLNDIVDAVTHLFQNQPDCIAAGGANLTPPNSTVFQRACGYVMGSSFATWQMCRRYKAGKLPMITSEAGLILCNLAIRREHFLQHNFLPGLASNEENILLQKIADANGILINDPELSVYHCRRETLRGFISQVMKYGLGRAQNIFVNPSSFRFVFLAPVCFLLYVTFLPMLLSVSGWWIIPLLGYLMLSCFFAIRIQVQLQRVYWLSFGLYFVVHMSYAWGLIKGVLTWARVREQVYETP